MIKTVLDNIFKAHDEHRGLDNHINLSAERDIVWSRSNNTIWRIVK